MTTPEPAPADLAEYREKLALVERAVEHWDGWSAMSHEQKAGILVALAVVGELDVTDGEQHAAIGHAKWYVRALGRKWQHSRPRGPLS